MNCDQFRSQWNQFKGELKKQWGKFIEDHLVQTEGDDEFIGPLQKSTETRRRQFVSESINGTNGIKRPGPD
ncbi:MAG TPA: hypothetical protein VF443_08660 [Nitrospira sp.]